MEWKRLVSHFSGHPDLGPFFGDREGGRISSRLHAVSAEPGEGLELTNHEIMTAPPSPGVPQSMEHPTLGFGSGHDPRVKGSGPMLGSVPSVESA